MQFFGLIISFKSFFPNNKENSKNSTVWKDISYSVFAFFKLLN